MTVLDGKKTSNDIKNEIAEKVKLLKKKRLSYTSSCCGYCWK